MKVNPRLAVLLLLAVAQPSCTRRRGEVEVASFEERVPTAAVRAPRGLRVAVAAMVSPEETTGAYARVVREFGASVGRAAEIIHGRSYSEVNARLATGDLDLAFICTGGYLELLEEGRGSDILLAVPRVAGRTTYRSVVIVRADSTALGFEELRGTRFVFTDPLSLTGHAYPASLARTTFRKSGASFASTAFVGSHDRAIRSVEQGLADAAGVDELIFLEWTRRRPAGAPRLRILKTSPDFGMPPVVAALTVSAETRRQWQEALLRLHERPEARRALEQLRIERVERVTAKLYDSARELWRAFK